MTFHPDYIDDDTLANAETEARESRPTPSAMWDDRLYETHFPVLSWAERGDDILAESNYLRVLEDLQGVDAHDRDDDTEYDGDSAHVIDATISDWLVGSLRQLFVQSRNDDGTFTAVWKEAVHIALALRDYPVYDESDYSEREWAEYERVLDDALNYAERDHAWDTDDEARDVRGILYRAIGEGFTFSDWSRAEDVDYDAVTGEYDAHRDAYFTAQAHDAMHAQLPGQLTL